MALQEWGNEHTGPKFDMFFLSELGHLEVVLGLQTTWAVFLLLSKAFKCSLSFCHTNMEQKQLKGGK